MPNVHIIRGHAPIIQAVYAQICYMSNARGLCWPSHASLAEYTGSSISSVQRALKSLVDLGVLEIHSRKDEIDGQKSNIYQIKIVPNDIPLSQADLPPSTTVTDRTKQTITKTNIDNTNVLSPDDEKSLKKKQQTQETTELIVFFQEQFAIKLRNMPIQRGQARNLIKAYGLDVAKRGVTAAALARNEPYSPIITDMSDLYNKWDKLKAFYQRKQQEQAQNVAILTDE